jgi:membrane protein YqaA with SNARE-associated domain
MRNLVRRLRSDAGMNTAEYAVGTLAAVAFASALLAVVRSDAIRNALQAIVERALG